MSSEIYELMKRSDEAAVVEKAHRRPRFVEDCVREAIGGVVELFGDMGDGTFVMARQENLETIHQHNVVAERFGLLGELRRELDDRRARAAPHVDARAGSTARAERTLDACQDPRAARRGHGAASRRAPRSRRPAGRSAPGGGEAAASWGSAPC